MVCNQVPKLSQGKGGIITSTTFNSTNGTITNGTITNLTGTAGTITNLSATNINASGIVTATTGFTSGIGVTDPVQITVAGSKIYFVVAGIGQTSLSLY